MGTLPAWQGERATMADEPQATLTLLPRLPLQVPAEWDRLARESPESWEGFCIYRGLPPHDRHLIRVAEALGKHRNSVERLARTYAWVARAAAWDAYLERAQDAAAAERLAAEALRVRDEQARAIRQGLEAARALKTQALRAIAREAKKPDIPGPDARALDLASKALERANHMERLAVGLPTDVTQQALAQKKLIDETLAVTNRVKEIIQEHLCDDCRALVGAELRRLSRRARSVAEQLA